jgi:nitrate/TMAO reductase-like tetraheme cytochrome c subunit
MSSLQSFRENWVRPALFFGNNPISLIGGAITTASGIAVLGYWILFVALYRQGVSNPYLNIIFAFLLPLLFVLGLILIPIGIIERRRKLQKAGQIPAVFPKINLSDPVFRHGVDIVLVATIANLLVVSVASYRGAAYMDSPQFCGRACHVMEPQFVTYQISPHSHVPCVACHIGPGLGSYVAAKVEGTRQVFEVATDSYPMPIPVPVNELRPARYTCESCHTPNRFNGDLLMVFSRFGDDQQNTETQTVLILHLGGVDSFSHRTGIHGVHLGDIEYVATDKNLSKIPWVEVVHPNGTKTVYSSLPPGSGRPKGELRRMDCIDCHNSTAHPFVTAEQAIDQAMSQGAISPSLPWVHKEGLKLLKASYTSQAQARVEIPEQLTAFYRAGFPQVMTSQAASVSEAGKALVTLYCENVFPFMKVTWGTYPNHIGHMSYPGCFRCHDGSHVAKDGSMIPMDCSVCHNLLAVDEPKPQVLSVLGIQ